MNAQLAVGWLAILLSFLIATGTLFAAARSVGAKPVSVRRVMSGLAIGTLAFYAIVWMAVMFLWVWAILIDLEWLPDRYFVWIFQALAAPWCSLWPFA